MRSHHYRFTRLFNFVFLFLSTTNCLSQQYIAGKQGNLFLLVNNKVDSFFVDDFLLMNARFYINKYPKSIGNPYFETVNSLPGKIVLGKKEYNDIELLYDIFDQKLNIVVKKTDNKSLILELNHQVITRFYLDDKVFVNSSELHGFPQSGFYEEIFLGKHIKVIARWSKLLINVTNVYIGEFNTQKRKLLFEINGNLVDVSSQHSFLKIFAGESKKIKSFMRKNKIQLSKSNNIELIELFKYADSLLL
jgi:hypothetical protein